MLVILEGQKIVIIIIIKIYQNNQKFITYILALPLLDGDATKLTVQENVLNSQGQHCDIKTRSCEPSTPVWVFGQSDGHDTFRGVNELMRADKLN